VAERRAGGDDRPKTATPTAIPPWRNASFVPAARPLTFSGHGAERDRDDRRVELTSDALAPDTRKITTVPGG
jgi:hypothetical protein